MLLLLLRMLRLLKACVNRLSESLLGPLGRLPNERLFSSGDHPTDHMSSYRTPQSRGDVSTVPSGLPGVPLLEQLGLRIIGGGCNFLSHFIFEAVEGLACLRQNRLIALLSFSHVSHLLSALSVPPLLSLKHTIVFRFRREMRCNIVRQNFD